MPKNTQESGTSALPTDNGNVSNNNVVDNSKYKDINFLKSLNVKIISHYRNGTRIKGSGVCLGENIIATNYHVVYPAHETPLTLIEIENVNGFKSGVNKLNVKNVEKDITILYTDVRVCTNFIPQSDFVLNAEKLDELIHIGNPGDLDWQVKTGRLELVDILKNLKQSVLSLINWITADTEVLTTTIDTVPGSSGGGVYNKNGLIGLLFAGANFEPNKKEVLVISAKYLLDFKEEKHLLSFNEYSNSSLEDNYMSINVNHQKTNFILSDSHYLSLPKNKLSEIKKENLFNPELHKIIEETKVRSLQFFSFNPNATVFFTLSDRNSDGIIDTVLAIGVEGFHKEFPNDYKLGFRFLLLDNDGDKQIDEFELIDGN